MSLARVTGRLPMRTCSQAINKNCKRMLKQRSTFEGVFAGFFWDQNTGFGYTDNGDTVFISREGTEIHEAQADADSFPESQVWLDITQPKLRLSHELLRDELQNNILVDDDKTENTLNPKQESKDTSELRIPTYELSLSDAYLDGSGYEPFDGPCPSSGGQNADGRGANGHGKKASG